MDSDSKRKFIDLIDYDFFWHLKHPEHHQLFTAKMQGYKNVATCFGWDDVVKLIDNVVIWYSRAVERGRIRRKIAQKEKNDEQQQKNMTNTQNTETYFVRFGESETIQVEAKDLDDALIEGLNHWLYHSDYIEIPSEEAPWLIFDHNKVAVWTITNNNNNWLSSYIEDMSTRFTIRKVFYISTQSR